MARDGDLPCMAVCATPVKGGTDPVPMKFVGSPLESGCSYYASCQLAKHARWRHEEEGTNTIFSLVNADTNIPSTLSGVTPKRRAYAPKQMDGDDPLCVEIFCHRGQVRRRA
jgi:hypothetical protein